MWVRLCLWLASFGGWTPPPSHTCPVPEPHTCPPRFPLPHDLVERSEYDRVRMDLHRAQSKLTIRNAETEMLRAIVDQQNLTIRELHS